MSDEKVENPLVKVTFEYAEGNKKVLEDIHLKNWIEFNRHVAAFASLHGNNPDWSKIKWVDSDY